MTGRRILQLGSGEKRLDASGDTVVRVDLRADVKPEVVWNLDQTPWPFEDSSFDVVDATDVIEHLSDVVKAMEEIHRVARPGALVRIVTPHFSSSNSFTDPTHRQHLGLFSFDYFTGANEWGFYSRVRFVKKKADLFFTPSIVNKVVWRLARRWPELWERRFAWMFPAWFMSFELEAVK